MKDIVNDFDNLLICVISMKHKKPFLNSDLASFLFQGNSGILAIIGRVNHYDILIHRFSVHVFVENGRSKEYKCDHLFTIIWPPILILNVPGT